MLRQKVSVLQVRTCKNMIYQELLLTLSKPMADYAFCKFAPIYFVSVLQFIIQKTSFLVTLFYNCPYNVTFPLLGGAFFFVLIERRS